MPAPADHVITAFGGESANHVGQFVVRAAGLMSRALRRGRSANIVTGSTPSRVILMRSVEPRGLSTVVVPPLASTVNRYEGGGMTGSVACAGCGTVTSATAATAATRLTRDRRGRLSIRALLSGVVDMHR